ncbi:hypothetical protein LSH36_21g10040 [Paralvinella palmiformis]|uniref:Uncharacterized protein n=1 Tax=Paralvinella palmiformis TaxID=53620 RepID=A0AAD9KBI0_9ANNE|nr:hypothetical protein LSH36_21g10040 [Paralvinella palmiformis]
MEVNSVNKPLVNVMINNSAVKVLVDTGSSKNLLDEETFKSLKKRQMLTKEHNPVIPNAGRSMNIRRNFCAEIRGNNATVSSTVYVTCDGKGNLLRGSIYEKKTNRYSKLCRVQRDTSLKAQAY